MSRMNNIEKLQKMKKLSELKAELHKQSALGYLPWNKLNTNEETWSKIIHYGELGYSIYHMLKNISPQQTESQEPA